MTTPIAKIVCITLASPLEGKDHVFRGHKFLAGEKIMCGTQNAIAAVLNSMRGRLPVSVEDMEPQPGLEAYRDYCKASGTPVDTSAVHHLGKAKGMVDLKVLAEDEDNSDLDAELDDLLNQGENSDSEDEDGDEDDDENDVDSSDVEDSDENDTVDDGNIIPAPEGVDPAIVRENSIRTALGQLDHDNPEHWTAQGLPKMTVLEEIMGDESLSRKEVTAVNPDFKRNH